MKRRQGWPLLEIIGVCAYAAYLALSGKGWLAIVVAGLLALVLLTAWNPAPAPKREGPGWLSRRFKSEGIWLVTGALIIVWVTNNFWLALGICFLGEGMLIAIRKSKRSGP